MRASPWVWAFAAVTTVHLVLLGLDVSPWDSVTKCLLAPVLIGWTVSSGGPRALVAFLAFCLLGDLFLELDGWFVPGMAAFAVAHVVLVTHLVRLGAARRLRSAPWLAIGYVVAGGLLVGWIWTDLPADLLVPVPFYAALLVATAATSAAIDRVVGAGGLAFLVSDAIIILGVTEQLPPDAAVTRLSIMVLYAAAIALITGGLLTRRVRGDRPGSSPLSEVARPGAGS